MRIPSCAPRPVPTSSAVGVARPSAHGQAMINTATAAVNAAGAVSPVPSQNPRVPIASTMTTGTNTAEIRSASRCTVALPFCASVTSLGDLGQRGVGTDTGGSNDEPSAGVDGCPGDRAARCDFDRHRLAGQQRRIDGRRSFFDDAVGGDLLAGSDDEQVADGELPDGDAYLGAVSQHGDVFGAHVEQRPQGGTGAALGPRFEVSAGEDEHGDR